MSDMLRVTLASVVLLALGGLVGVFADELGSWGQLVGAVAVMLAVSAVLPHYFYRGEPLLPGRHKRR